MHADELLPLTPLSFQILLAIADGPRHGYGIIKEIETRTGRPLKSSTGTLYLAIQRLEQEELIAETDDPGTQDSGDSRRRYYDLTALGQEVAAAEARRLLGLVGIARQKRLLSAKALSVLSGSGKAG